MADQCPFAYIVTNMFSCVLGHSDYQFSCVVFADSEDDARTWGLNVAERYAQRFGFHPHGIKPTRDDIESNAYVWACENADDADLVCVFGEYPESVS